LASRCIARVGSLFAHDLLKPSDSAIFYARFLTEKPRSRQ
jgi:hypothetical protein